MQARNMLNCLGLKSEGCKKPPFLKFLVAFWFQSPSFHVLFNQLLQLTVIYLNFKNTDIFFSRIEWSIMSIISENKENTYGIII